MTRIHSLFDPEWTAGDYRPVPVAYYYRQWIDFTMAFHAHREVEMMVVVSGACTVELEKERRSVPMRKGDAILLDAGVRHRLLVGKDSPCRMLNVEFGFTECGGIYPSLRQLAEGNPAVRRLLGGRCDYLLIHDPSDMQQTLKSLVMELDTFGASDPTLVNLLLSQLLVRVARLTGEAAGDQASRQTDRYVRRALEYIHQHYDCDIQAKDVAAAVNLHPVYLQRIFQRSAGMTMTEYLNRHRIEKAKMLLSRTDIPIAEIAEYVGVSSRQYFSELFKKVTGDTPAAYRKSVDAFHGFDNRVEIVDMNE